MSRALRRVTGGSGMVRAVDDGSWTLFDVPPDALDAARETLIGEGQLRVEAHAPSADATPAMLFPASMRAALFRDDLASAIRSASGRGAQEETLDALLAVFVQFSLRFPEAS